MARRITISAPSRLHFGLFSVGDVVTHQFGGVGLMIESPRTTLHVTPAVRLSVNGPNAESCRTALETWLPHVSTGNSPVSSFSSVSELPIQIDIESVPPRHSGLGTGTQLALCSVMAVMRFLDIRGAGPEEFAVLTGRGRRSGIGTHGFFQGGFIVDRGKAADEALAPLDFQTAFPPHWPVVTVIHTASMGLSGNQELNAFRKLAPTTESERNEMIDIVRRQMIPGVLQDDYDLFASGIYEFGRRSGMMFSSIQHGAFNGPIVKSLVNEIRDFGIDAVGQSSWGPCVFAIARNDQQAQQLVNRLTVSHGNDCLINITRSDNHGARIVDEG